MKRIIILLVITLSLITPSLTTYAQDYTRQGTEFISTKTTTSKSKAQKTGYTYKDTDGKSYEIYLSAKGKAFIKRISKKTGKEYNKYLPDSIAETIKKELGIA